MRTLAPLLGEPPPVELMNTIWADRRGTAHDAIATDPELSDWLHDALQIDGALARPLARRYRSVRTALRTLAAGATGDDRPAPSPPTAPAAAMSTAEAVHVVNAASARTPSWSELRWDTGATRVSCTAHPGAEAMLSAIAEQAVTLLAADAAGGLRACHAPGCVLYFVHDHPRREWCSAGCGNRARAARHYDRHRRSPRREF